MTLPLRSRPTLLFLLSAVLVYAAPVCAGKAPPRRAVGYLRATAFGDPTLLLELSREVTAEGSYGIRKPIQRIGLAPDDLPAFMKALQSRLAPSVR